MSNTRPGPAGRLRTLSVGFGVALLAYLVVRTGPHLLWHNIRSVRYGFAIILCLGGVAHLVKTWAWRCTFTCDISHLSWRRSFAMRLISEAIGQLGIAGKLIGEGVRVSLLGPGVPTANAVSAAALDSLLYILTSLVVAIAAILTTVFAAPLPGNLRVFALLFSGIFAVVLGLGVVGIARGWPAMAVLFRMIGRIPGCRDWVSRKQQVIEAAERNLLNFHRDSPAGFRTAIILNFGAHALAVTEIYIVIRFLMMRATPVSAFVLEGMTKLINMVGALNPGNVGTYEGGNMLFGKALGLTASTALTVALCRRARALFWSAIGAVCLTIMRRPDRKYRGEITTNMTKRRDSDNFEPDPHIEDSANTVLILADWEQAAVGFSPSLTRVATLPLLLRNVLAIRAANPDRILVCAPAESADHIRKVLLRTARMPAVEWRDIADSDLTPVLAEIAASSRNIVLVLGSRSYQPQLLNDAVAAAPSSALELANASELAGVCVLSASTALAIGSSGARIRTLKQLHSWLEEKACPETKNVPAQSWQRVAKPSDVRVAEQKMEAWLIKPTDGIFARMNRRVSIPISRQLIKFPITPNMVSLFVLVVSLACGYFYAGGGYWGCLIAALLAVAGSILDGCDGEVARFKLQSTPFGCWVDTVCDYLYYIAAFGGMAIGLSREPELKHSYAWGGLLLFGAVTTFLIVSLTRQRLAGASPEKLLGIWQKKAESRSSNPLIYFGRQTEFIVRRCFHPYALVAFALFGATKVVFIGAALGANIAWVVALYSYLDFSRDLRSCVPSGQTVVITPGANA